MCQIQVCSAILLISSPPYFLFFPRSFFSCSLDFLRTCSFGRTQSMHIHQFFLQLPSSLFLLMNRTYDGISFLLKFRSRAQHIDITLAAVTQIATVDDIIDCQSVFASLESSIISAVHRNSFEIISHTPRHDAEQ